MSISSRQEPTVFIRVIKFNLFNLKLNHSPPYQIKTDITSLHNKQPGISYNNRHHCLVDGDLLPITRDIFPPSPTSGQDIEKFGSLRFVYYNIVAIKSCEEGMMVLMKNCNDKASKGRRYKKECCGLLR